MMKRTNTKRHQTILRYAKSKGFLTPLWLMPSTDADGVKRAFQELETFLHDSFSEDDLVDINLTDIKDFIWKLQKTYAYEGWEGIAPYLLRIPFRTDKPIVEGLVE
jgi:hypothetical protein